MPDANLAASPKASIKPAKDAAIVNKGFKGDLLNFKPLKIFTIPAIVIPIKEAISPRA